MSDQAKAEAEAKAKKEADEKAATEKEAADKKAKAEAEAKAKAPKRSTHHVVGPGSVHLDGETYAAGSELELTDAEAQGLGGSVGKGKAPSKAGDIASRKAGRYRVAGPGSLWHDGRAREAGYEFECDEADARRLGAAITPV